MRRTRKTQQVSREFGVFCCDVFPVGDKTGAVLLELCADLQVFDAIC